MGPGTQGLSFLKKAPEEIKLTKKKKMQNLQEGRKGSRLRGLECPVWAQIPHPFSAPWLLGLEEKHRRGESSSGRKADVSRGKSLQPNAGGDATWESQEDQCPCLYIPTTLSLPEQPLLTCMISHRPSAPARVPVLGVILHKEENQKFMVQRTK